MLPPVLVLLSVVMGQHSALTPAQIAEAIAAGTSKADLTVYAGKSGRGSDFALAINGPMARVSVLSHHAAKAYKTLTPADIEPAESANTVVILASPNVPKFRSSYWDKADLATGIVVFPQGATDPIRPLSEQTFPVDWSNAMGGSFQGQGIISTFDRATFPIGEFEVVVLTNREEKRYRVKAKDAARVR